MMNIYKKHTRLIAILTMLTFSLYSSVQYTVNAEPLKNASTTIEVLTSKCECRSFTKDQINDMIKQYILSNPETVIQAISIGLEKEQRLEPSILPAADVEKISTLHEFYNLPSLGNNDSKILVSIFYDYSCPYSRQFNNIINKLIDNNSDIRVTYLPISFLRGESSYVASTALAVNYIDPSKFAEFHSKILNLESITRTGIKEILAEIGMTDMNKIEEVKESNVIAQMIQIIEELTAKVNLKAVPAIIIGNELQQGLIPIDQLQAKIQKIRKEISVEHKDD